MTPALMRNTDARTNITFSGQPDQWRTNILRGTKTVTVAGSVGEVLRRESYDIDPGHANPILTGREVYGYSDALKRSYTVTYLDGTSGTVQYACCGLATTRGGGNSR